MSSQFEDPPRWREHANQLNPAERALGHAVRAIRTPTPLSASQMARLAFGLPSPRTRHPRLWIVVAASFLLGLATAASAARLDILPRWLTGTAKSKPAQVPTPRAGMPARRSPGGGSTTPLPSTAVLVPTGPAVAPALALSPLPAQMAVAPRFASPGQREHSFSSNDFNAAPAGRSRPSAEKAVVLQPADSHVLTALPSAESNSPPQAGLPARLLPPTAMLEPPASVQPVSSIASGGTVAATDDPSAAKVLADALRVLRVEGAPESALAMLDRNARLLSRSPYGREILLVRVEALLALRRDRELLHLLDGTALADGAASRALLVTRGKLRAAANRCAEAVADFDRVLAEAGRADTQALLGRAACREKLGDRDGARADRERYRQQLSVTR